MNLLYHLSIIQYVEGSTITLAYLFLFVFLTVISFLYLRTSTSYKKLKSEFKQRVINSHQHIKRSEQALFCSEKKFYSFFHLSPIALSISELDSGIFIEINQSCKNLFGAEKMEDLLGKSSIELGFFQPDERKRVISELKTDKYKINSLEIKTLDHKKIFVEWYATIYDLNGKTYIISNFVDNTEKLKSDAELKESEEKYRTVFKTIPDGLAITQFNGTFIDVNEGFVNISGYQKVEILNTIIFNIWVKTEERQSFLNDLIKKGSIENREIEVRKKNGEIIMVNISAGLITINNEFHVLSIIKDVSEEKQNKISLLNNALKFRKIFNASKDGIILLDKKLFIIDANEAFIAMSNHSKEEVVDAHLGNFFKLRESNTLMAGIFSYWSHKPIDTFETELSLFNEIKFPVEISANTLKLNNEELLMLLIRDISERKRLEKEISSRVIETEEREKQYFSQELHDGLGPLISAAKLYTQLLNKQGIHNECITEVEKLLTEALTTIKDISFKISPHILHNFGIVEAIQIFGTKVEQASGLKIHIRSELFNRLNDKNEIILYRILCECINNTIKHASATNIYITFAVNGKNLSINYADDGIGFDKSVILTNHKGIGLLNMQNRIKMIGGRMVIDSHQGSGVLIFIEIARF